MIINCVERCIAFVFLFTVFFQNVALSLPMQGHVKEWNEAIGAVEFDSRRALDPLWRTLADAIDREASGYSELEKDIRDLFPQYTRGRIGHRLFFHWGFNQNPRHFTPLIRQLKDCDLDEEAVDKVCDMIISEQRKRNRNIIDSVSSTTGIMGPNARGLATILYNVHLLSDYKTENSLGLLPLYKLNLDTIEQGFGRLLPNEGKEKYLDAIRFEMEGAYLSPGSDRDRASNMLAVTSYYLASTLSQYYAKTLEVKGIRLAVPSENAKLPWIDTHSPTDPALSKKG